ncbi:MAG: cytochrome c [Pseudopedobacter sp.]|nr:cytochrome c [Deinococcales bacterium]
MKKFLLSGLTLWIGSSVLGSGALAQGGGARVYVAYCQGCHQAGGQGNKGIFPPLNKYVPKILAAKGGRQYLANIMIGGLQGPIQVSGVKYNQVMPAFSQLNDADLAGLLNYISTSWDNKFPKGQKTYTADEIKAARVKKPNAQTNYKARPKTLK